MSQAAVKPDRAAGKRVDRFCPLDTYRESREHLFPSLESLRWFVRRNRACLVASGGLLMIAGRWMVDPDRFDETVVKVGEQAAQRAA